MILEMSEPIASLLATADPESGLLPKMSNQTSFYLMTGLLIFFSLLSGILIYHSLNFAHAQHGHDDH
jgi:hypothetical protein